MRGQALHLSTDTLTEATDILEPRVMAETAETVTVRATVLLENRNQSFRVRDVEFIVSKVANSVVEYRYK